MSIVTYGLGINGDTVDYASVYGFGILPLYPFGQIPQYLYIVAEEVRFPVIQFIYRVCEISYEPREDLIMYENRYVTISDSDKE